MQFQSSLITMGRTIGRIHEKVICYGCMITSCTNHFRIYNVMYYGAIYRPRSQGVVSVVISDGGGRLSSGTLAIS